MKKIALFLLIITTMTSCTQQSVVKSTALRYVIEEHEAQFGQDPDKKQTKEQRQQTRMDVVNVEMISDTEANVTIEIKNPTETKQTKVHLVKNNSAWSVQK